jgi:hypothetical protein
MTRVSSSLQIEPQKGNADPQPIVLFSLYGPHLIELLSST